MSSSRLNLVFRFLLPAIIGLISCEEEDRVVLTNTTSPPFLVTLSPEEVAVCSATVGGCFRNNYQGTPSRAGICFFRKYDRPYQEVSIVRGASERRYANLITGGRFTVGLTDLLPETAYCYLAFAEYGTNIIYGDLRILVTSSGVVKDNDGNIYQTIRIGDQVWMRENLRSHTYPDGDMIDGFIETGYGGLTGTHYAWQAATGQGLKLARGKDACPDGWHVPGDSDWRQLLNYTGIPADQMDTFNLIGDNQSSMLKDSGSDSWKYEKNSNSTGFSVLPANAYSGQGEDLGPVTLFWTSTPFIYYGFPGGTGKIFRGHDPSGSMYLSVRCIKD